MSLLTVENQDFLLTLSNLSALADGLGAKANSLSLIPSDATSDGQRAQALVEFRQLDSVTQERLTIALGTLCAPAKTANLHHTIADESISRAVLAWSTSLPDVIVAVAGTTDPRRISFWSEQSMTSSVRTILAADARLRDDEMARRVTTPAALVFLAALDQVRAVRFYSMLTHAAPLAMFSQAEILDRLKDAASEDFRWPLAFAEKLLPRGVVGSFSAIEVNAALNELVSTGLIEAVAPGRYEMSDLGKIICDGVVHDVSKVALGVTQPRPDGELGHDVVLLIRSSFHLFMIALAGQEAVIAAVTSEELAAVLHLSLRLIDPPLAETTVAASAAKPSSSEIKPHDVDTKPPFSLKVAPPTPKPASPPPLPLDSASGAKLVPPLPLPKVCSNCNKILGLNAKFCSGCGKPVYDR
jgi:hypothetical protein